MKKFNKVLVIVLAVVLLVLCAAPSTFSWFTRPQSLKGSSLKWDGIKYSANSDTSSVTMTTKQSIWLYSDNREDTDFNTVEDVTDINNKLYQYNFATTQQTLGSGSARYYSTAITNSSDKDVTVSLYIPNMTAVTYNTTTAQPFYLGVNGPAKTYKLYGANLNSSGQKVTNSDNTMRVYFQPKNNDGVWAGEYNKFYIVYTNNGTETKKALTEIGYFASGNSNTYYVDIPTSTTSFVFYNNYNQENKTDAWQYSEKVTVNSSSLNAKSSKVYWVTNPDNNGSGNKVINNSSVDGASIYRYYSTASVTVGSTFDASLSKGTDVAGSTSYASSNTSIFTVNSSGVITGKKAGTATLTYTVKGDYGDTVTKTCTVTVTAASTATSELTNVPVVTNYVIPAATKDEDGNTVPTTKYVYWYIKNDYSTQYLAYTINNLELTL